MPYAQLGLRLRARSTIAICGVEILVEIPKDVGCAGERNRVISTSSEGSASEIDADAPIAPSIRDPDLWHQALA